MSCVATEKTVAVSTGAGNLINVPVPCTVRRISQRALTIIIIIIITRQGSSWATWEGASLNTQMITARASAFLFQCISTLIQRFNAVAVLGTLDPTTPEEDV